MADDFRYDVFLSHSSQDKATVRALAGRLRGDGLRVWLDEWELRPGDNVPARIEEGLEHSRVLVLCMSARAFGSDWAQLESQTFRFRDPLNRRRRFVPLRLDATEPRGSLAQFSYINWLPKTRKQEYPKLLEACLPPANPPAEEAQATQEQFAEKVIKLKLRGPAWAYAFGTGGKFILDANLNGTVRLWHVETGHCLRVFTGHAGSVYDVAWSADERRALSASGDGTLRLWDVETGRCLRVLEGHTDRVYSVAWSADQRHALSGSRDQALRLWDVETGRCLRVLEGHVGMVWDVAWSADQRRALSAAWDKTLRLWDVETGRALREFTGHTGYVNSVAWSADERRALSGASDNTLRLWDVETGRCLRVLEGHTDGVHSVAWSADGRRALSGSADNTLRLWDVETGRCLRVLKGHSASVYSVSWSADHHHAISGDMSGGIRVWDLSEFVGEARPIKVVGPGLPEGAPEQVEYTNAKVLLVGESGAGKTGLSKRLALRQWEPSDSTVGAWATQWKLPVDSGDGVEREIWLWDFGGTG